MGIKRVIVDNKQPPQFQGLLRQNFDAIVANLGDNSGDVLITLDGTKTIAIEVKEVPGDFLASIMDRRLFRQAEGIRSITPWAFLLLSGDFSYNGQWQVMGRNSSGYGALGSWSREHIEQTLVAVNARGVMVRYAYRGYVDAINRMASWVETADTGSITTDPIKLSPIDSDDQSTVNLLAWFPGIGVTQAKNFLKWSGRQPRYKILELALTEFEGDNKPDGWTNNTIKRNREQMQYPVQRTEWVEEIDV